MCEHVIAKIQQFAGLSVKDANAMAAAWSEQLWALLPQQYADRPLAATGGKTRTQDSTVNLRAIRQSFGLAIWHPEDKCGHLDTKAMVQRQASGLRRLFGIGAKGGAA
jgi:hypothetical protein